MATKTAAKGTAKGTAVGKAANTAVASYEERLAKHAAETEDQGRKISAGKFISMRGGVMMYDDNPVAGNQLDTVVVDFVNENAFYDGKFDPNNPRPPVCYAFGRSEDEMKPHPDAPEPQCETCDECEHNKFGTADDGEGKGKACKNIVRLALLPASPLTVEAVRKADFAFVKTPVTSVKAWEGYKKSLKTLQKTIPIAVVTTISCTPDPKSQFKVTFGAKAALPAAIGNAVFDRLEEAGEALVQPYPEPEEKAPPAKPATRKSAAKKKY